MIQDGSMGRLYYYFSFYHQYISTSFRIYLGPSLSLWYFFKKFFLTCAYFNIVCLSKPVWQ